MGGLLSIDDVPSNLANAEIMVAGANGQAERIAPCLFAVDLPPTQAQLNEARLVLLGAVVRWSQQGANPIAQQSAGPFSVGYNNSKPGYKLWPSEITQLQDICTGGTTRTAFSIDTAPGDACSHLPWCDVMFGGLRCSCGVSIAGRPIYENKPGL